MGQREKSSGGRELTPLGRDLPDYASSMLLQASADRRQIQPAVAGYQVIIKEYGPVQTGLLKVGAVVLTCSSGRDE